MVKACIILSTICLVTTIVNICLQLVAIEKRKRYELYDSLINVDSPCSGITEYTYSLANLNNYQTVVYNEVNIVQAREEVLSEKIEEIQETIANEKEVDLLARVIYNECGILGHDAMYLCGCVVLNRINSSKFPNTLQGVVYQKHNGTYQYQIVTNGMINNAPTDEAKQIARELLKNGSTIPSDVVFQAQFKQGSYVYQRIGNTYFCGL